MHQPNRVYCYAAIVVYSLAVAVTIASTHCAYLPTSNGHAELTWVARWFTHPVTNRGQRRATSLIETNALHTSSPNLQALKQINQTLNRMKLNLEPLRTKSHDEIDVVKSVLRPECNASAVA